MTRHTNISYPHPTIKAALGGGLRWFSYALKLKLPGGMCLIIIGTEGFSPADL
jgi:hypothetical protein